MRAGGEQLGDGWLLGRGMKKGGGEGHRRRVSCGRCAAQPGRRQERDRRQASGTRRATCGESGCNAAGCELAGCELPDGVAKFPDPHLIVRDRCGRRLANLCAEAAEAPRPQRKISRRGKSTVFPAKRTVLGIIRGQQTILLCTTNTRAGITCKFLAGRDDSNLPVDFVGSGSPSCGPGCLRQPLELRAGEVVFCHALPSPERQPAGFLTESHRGRQSHRGPPRKTPNAHRGGGPF